MGVTVVFDAPAERLSPTNSAAHFSAATRERSAGDLRYRHNLDGPHRLFFFIVSTIVESDEITVPGPGSIAVTVQFDASSTTSTPGVADP